LKDHPLLYCSPGCASVHAATPASERQHAREQEALEDEGLAPAPKVVDAVGKDLSRLEPLLDVERRTFGKRVRLGVNASELLQIATDGDAQSAHAVRGKLMKPLSALKGTKLGRRRAISDAMADKIVALRDSDPAKWTWPNLAKGINAKRIDAGLAEVSPMAVKRAYERRAAERV
jgi:hypothetical protein